MGRYRAVRGEEGEGESMWPWGRQVLSNGDAEELPGERAELRRARRACGKDSRGQHRLGRCSQGPRSWRLVSACGPQTQQDLPGQSVTQAELGASRASRRLGSRACRSRVVWTEAKRRSRELPRDEHKSLCVTWEVGNPSLAGSHHSQK